MTITTAAQKKIKEIIEKGLAQGKLEERGPKTIKFIPVAITAKIVRVILADRFPGVTFRVRSQSYAGGSSVDIYYRAEDVDTKEVREVAQAMQGIGFDGMTDSTYYLDPKHLGGYNLEPASYIFERPLTDEQAHLRKEHKLEVA